MERQLSETIELIRLLILKVNKLMAQIDTLTADVTALQTAVASLIALNDTTQAQLAQLLAGGAPDTDLAGVIASIETTTASIVADLAKTAPVPPVAS